MTDVHEYVLRNSEEHSAIKVSLSKLTERSHEQLNTLRDLEAGMDRTERDRLDVTHRFEAHMGQANRGQSEMLKSLDSLNKGLSQLRTIVLYGLIVGGGMTSGVEVWSVIKPFLG